MNQKKSGVRLATVLLSVVLLFAAQPLALAGTPLPGGDLTSIHHSASATADTTTMPDTHTPPLHLTPLPGRTCNCHLALNTSSTSSSPILPERQSPLTPSVVVPLARAIKCHGISLLKVASINDGTGRTTLTLSNSGTDTTCIHIPRGLVLSPAAGSNTQVLIIVDDTYTAPPCLPPGSVVDLPVSTVSISPPGLSPPSPIGSPYTIKTFTPSDAPLHILRNLAIHMYRQRSSDKAFADLTSSPYGPNAVLQLAMYILYARYSHQNEPSLAKLQALMSEHSPQLATASPERRAQAHSLFPKIHAAATDLVASVLATTHSPFLQSQKDAVAYENWKANTPLQQQQNVLYTTFDELVNCLGAPLNVRGSKEKLPSYLELDLTNPGNVPIWVYIQPDTFLTPNSTEHQIMGLFGAWLFIPGKQTLTATQPSFCYDLRSLKTPPAVPDQSIQYSVNNIPPDRVSSLPFLHVGTPATNVLYSVSMSSNIPYDGVPTRDVVPMQPPPGLDPDVHPAASQDYLKQLRIWDLFNYGTMQVNAGQKYDPLTSNPAVTDVSPDYSSHVQTNTSYASKPENAVTYDAMKDQYLGQIPPEHRNNPEVKQSLKDIFKNVHGATKANINILKSDPAYQNAQNFVQNYIQNNSPPTKVSNPTSAGAQASAASPPSQQAPASASSTVEDSNQSQQSFNYQNALVQAGPTPTPLKQNPPTATDAPAQPAPTAKQQQMRTSPPTTTPSAASTPKAPAANTAKPKSPEQDKNAQKNREEKIAALQREMEDLRIPRAPAPPKPPGSLPAPTADTRPPAPPNPDGSLPAPPVDTRSRAIAVLKQLLEILQQSPEDPRIAHTLKELSNLSAQMGHHQDSAKYDQGYVEFLERTSPKSLPAAYSELASKYEDSENWHEAANYMRKAIIALMKSQEQGNTPEQRDLRRMFLSNGQAHLGRLSERTNNLVEAERSYQEALSLAHKIEPSRDHGVVMQRLFDIATFHDRHGAGQKAREEYQQAEKAARRVAYELPTANWLSRDKALTTLAHILVRQDKLADAGKMLLEREKILEKIGLPPWWVVNEYKPFLENLANRKELPADARELISSIKPLVEKVHMSTANPGVELQHLCKMIETLENRLKPAKLPPKPADLKSQRPPARGDLQFLPDEDMSSDLNVGEILRRRGIPR